MKKLLIISFLGLFLGLNTATAEEKTLDQKKRGSTRVDSNQIDSGNAPSNLMMKISEDQDDEIRRKEFLEELRKLYKANFL